MGFALCIKVIGPKMIAQGNGQAFAFLCAGIIVYVLCLVVVVGIVVALMMMDVRMYA